MNRWLVRSPFLLNLFYQAIFSVPVAAILLLIEVKIAYSFMSGVAIYASSNAYFVYYAFRYRKTEYTPWIVQSFYWGETGKLGLSLLGFALVFRFLQPISAFGVFVGFISMIFLQIWCSRRILSLLSHEQAELSKKHKS